MKTTVKKFSQLLELCQLSGHDPSGKPTTLCDAFYIDIDPTLHLAKVSASGKTGQPYINVSMETDDLVASRIPIIAEELIGTDGKLGRFNDADIISVILDGNTTKISREKPKKTFTINNPIETITSYVDPAGFQFTFNPTCLDFNGNVFNVVIKTTAEAMLDVIEDAKPFYKKIQDVRFPMTITNDSVRLDIGDKTVGSVESELQVTSIATPVQKKAIFGPGFHNIFNVISGPVTLYFGEIKGATKMNPSMIVVWESGIYKAKYILKGF